jgi:23S rRNA (adenine2503-C2)-methyltransferase
MRPVLLFLFVGVLIPEANRATLCLSSQVGCSLSCKFCHTGTQKLMRNLEASEIISQYLVASRKGPLSNIVFMGQGEPLYNWRNVRRAVHILTDPLGPGFGRSKIVVSTSGIVPAIPRIASELGVQLAISLHATNDELRSELMPINKTFPLAELMKACDEFVALSSSNNRRITFEYVMLDGINDNVGSDAKGLLSLLSKLPAHVNLMYDAQEIQSMSC